MRNLLLITALLLTSCQGFFNTSVGAIGVTIQTCQDFADQTNDDNWKLTITYGDGSNTSWMRFKSDIERNLFKCEAEERNIETGDLTLSEAEAVSAILTVNPDRVYLEVSGSYQESVDLFIQIRNEYF